MGDDCDDITCAGSAPHTATGATPSSEKMDRTPFWEVDFLGGKQVLVGTTKTEASTLALKNLKDATTIVSLGTS